MLKNCPSRRRGFLFPFLRLEKIAALENFEPKPRADDGSLVLGDHTSRMLIQESDTWVFQNRKCPLKCLLQLFHLLLKHSKQSELFSVLTTSQGQRKISDHHDLHFREEFEKKLLKNDHSSFHFLPNAGFLNQTLFIVMEFRPASRVQSSSPASISSPVPPGSMA